MADTEKIKTCSRCNSDQLVSMFSRDASRRDGLHPWCKECRRASSKKWVINNPEAQRARVAKWRNENKEAARILSKKSHAANKEKRNEYSREYRQTHLEKMRALGRAWSKNNPEAMRKINSSRRAAKLKAIPSWASEELDNLIVNECYDLANIRTKLTGIVWHVDHIVPLRSKKVCGLHCSANLQVIPAIVNHSKGNRTWPCM